MNIKSSMACKMLMYWSIVFLFSFALDHVSAVQNNTTTSSLLPQTTTITSAATARVSTTASPSSRSTTPQSTATPTTPSSITPAIFITLYFTIPWKQFCPLREKFREKFSAHLIEQNDDKTIHIVTADRIRYVNVVRYCEGNIDGEEKAKVEMYIAKKGELGIVDEDMTISAYRILDDYVVNKKMAKIDAVFADKVKYVSISGSKAPKAGKQSSLTEFDKVAIGIGACLVVIFVATIIYRRRQAYLRKSTTRQAVQANRPSEHELQVLRLTDDA